MSGIEYTPKEPREKIRRKLTKEMRRKMSEGGKRADRNGTAKARRSNSLRRFINDNPLRTNEFYIRYYEPEKGHRRHAKTNQLFVSLNGTEWFEVEDIIKKLEGATQDG